MKQSTEKTVTAKAKCNSYDIEIIAKFKPRGLVADETSDVQRKLRQKISEMISGLPFSHIYPHEVKVK